MESYDMKLGSQDNLPQNRSPSPLPSAPPPHPMMNDNRSFGFASKSPDSAIPDWNMKFYEALHTQTHTGLRSSHSHTPLNQIKRVVTLSRLCKQFAEESGNIAEIIIRERGSAPGEWTIPPVTSLFGGIAGGEKYVHRNIFFKFAFDKYGLYDGDENAMKVSR
jgi:hypothetical protein